MISVIVIAKNEEKMIRYCLESIKWADEIIIADNGSTDKTVEIAREYTSKIINFMTQDLAELRNSAIKHAKGDWVLYIDADERVIAPLREEIQHLLINNKYAAYAISRKNIIFGVEVDYGPYKKDWVIRLFKRSNFEGWVGKVHEYGKFKGDLGYTKNSLLHLTHRSLDHVMNKTLEWSKIDAKLRYDTNHPKMSGWRFLRILITETFNQGIIRQGFFGGTVGMIDSILQSFSMFITYVRLWELQQKKALDEVYDEMDEKLMKNGFNL